MKINNKDNYHECNNTKKEGYSIEFGVSDVAKSRASNMLGLFSWIDLYDVFTPDYNMVERGSPDKHYHSHAWNAGNGLNVEIIIGRCEPHGANAQATGGLFDAQEINYPSNPPTYTVVGSPVLTSLLSFYQYLY